MKQRQNNYQTMSWHRGKRFIRPRWNKIKRNSYRNDKRGFYRYCHDLFCDQYIKVEMNTNWFHWHTWWTITNRWKRKYYVIAYEKTEKFQLTSFSPMFTSSWFVKSVISFLSVLQLITSNLLKKGKRICNEITLNHWRPFSFISTSKKEHFSLFLFIHIFKS